MDPTGEQREEASDPRNEKGERGEKRRGRNERISRAARDSLAWEGSTHARKIDLRQGPNPPAAERTPKAERKGNEEVRFGDLKTRKRERTQPTDDDLFPACREHNEEHPSHFDEKRKVGEDDLRAKRRADELCDASRRTEVNRSRLTSKWLAS